MIPFLLLIFTTLYMMGSEKYYDPLLREDQIVEWLTAVFLFATAALTGFMFFKFKGHANRIFFLLFAIFCLFGGLEEISWGQRIFGIESNEFFMKYNRQGETNIHNITQQLPGIPQKYNHGIILLVWGALLPYLCARFSRLKKFLKFPFLVIPPQHLVLGFVISALLMLDRPTGFEEELGELFFGVCFFLFILYEYLFATRWNRADIKEEYSKLFSPGILGNYSSVKLATILLFCIVLTSAQLFSTYDGSVDAWPKTVYIAPDDNLSEISEKLRLERLIRSSSAFYWYVKITNKKESIKPGYHQINHKSSLVALVETLEQ